MGDGGFVRLSEFERRIDGEAEGFVGVSGRKMKGFVMEAEKMG